LGRKPSIKATERVMLSRSPSMVAHTLGLMLHALVTAVNVQDCNGGVLLLSTLFGSRSVPPSS
jgi:hypothetical protein